MSRGHKTKTPSRGASALSPPSAKRQKGRVDSDKDEYLPDDSDTAIDSTDQGGDNEQESVGVTFTVVDGVINVDVPTCTGDRQCSVLHSTAFPILPPEVASNHRGYTKGFLQPGIIAILRHCDLDPEIFNDHKLSAKHAECNTKHFDSIHYRLTNTSRNDKEKKMTKLQSLKQLLLQSEQAIKDAPPELVAAFEDAIRPPPLPTSSSSSSSSSSSVDLQLRGDFNKVAAEWRGQLEGIVKDQQEREATREKDQREREAKRDKTMRDEVGKQVAQGFKAVKKEMLEEMQRVFGSHPTVSQAQRNEVGTDIKQAPVARGQRNQKAAEQKIAVNDIVAREEEEEGEEEEEEEEEEDNADDTGRQDDKQNAEENDEEEGKRSASTSIVGDQEKKNKSAKVNKGDQTKKVKTDDKEKEEEEKEEGEEEAEDGVPKLVSQMASDHMPLKEIRQQMEKQNRRALAKSKNATKDEQEVLSKHIRNEEAELKDLEEKENRGKEQEKGRRTKAATPKKDRLK